MVVAHSLCRDFCMDYEIILPVDENFIFPDAPQPHYALLKVTLPISIFR